MAAEAHLIYAAIVSVLTGKPTLRDAVDKLYGEEK